MAYFSEEQRKQMRGNPYPSGSLEHIVSRFPVQLKQAMYAAAKTGRLNYRSWDNCAFNAAGKQVGRDDVASTLTAAQTFGISTGLVSEFISKWDSLNTRTERLPRILMSVLSDVGITTPPEAFKRDSHDGVLVVDHTVFKGTQTEWLEKLETVDTLADLGITDAEIEAVSDLVGAIWPNA